MVPPCGTLHSGATPPRICVAAVATQPVVLEAESESGVEQLGLF